ncbi:MAG: PepSY domain-containing protein [Psychrobium sp.]|nr:PepSY domain-containing protein [Psychrobium sp.]
MNKESIKQLINAHGWLGLIISGVLFVVFFAGSISFFRPEIMAWSMQPHFEVNKGQQAPVSEILASALANRNYDAKEHLTLIFPRDDNPYYRAYIDIKDRPVEPHYDALTIDPVTAKIIYEGDKFELADFLYLMHINLHIPFGSYVVGFVALFFFFALISGVFIHARKLLRNFFQYRNGDHKRSQLLDMHNVVGVMSLPFTIMYALTGLIFNLVIIYQASFAMILYQGDQDKLVQDAGYVLIAPEWQDKPSPMTDIDNIIDATTEKYGVAPRVVTFYNYGDAGSVMQIRGVDAHEFGSQFNVSYSTVDGSLLRSQDKFNPNIFQQGLNSLSKLHFGDYAGIDLRIIYF